MNNQANQNDRFSTNIDTATKSLRGNECEKAYDMITEAMHLAPDSPQPHNLLGIYFELKGNDDKARRHYRAAYALDPTYKPACWNLEQICTLLGNTKLRTFDFGDEQAKA